MAANGIQFEEEPSAGESQPQSASITGKFVAWLIRRHIVKDPLQANYLLLGIVVIAVIAIFIIVAAGDRQPVGPTPEQQLELQSMNAHR